MSGRLSIFDELCKRTLNFVCSCVNSSNNVVRNVCHYSFGSGLTHSPLFCNALYVCQRYNFQLSNIFDLRNMSFCNRLISYFCAQTYNIDDINLLLELVMIRDSIFSRPSAFTSAEIDFLINHICTS